MPSPDSANEAGKSLSEIAYETIKRDILGAVLVPGERLKLDALSERYSIGVVPLREALNRLSSESFVFRKNQRGFEVATMSLASLEELVKTRIWLETRALTESVNHATQEWEESLILAHHRLSRTRRMIEEPDGEHVNTIWEDVHKTFHMQLIANCGSSWLLEFCSTMMDQSIRYRNHSVNISLSRSNRAIDDEHKGILEAVLAQDTDRSVELLEAHYLFTLNTLRDELA